MKKYRGLLMWACELGILILMCIAATNKDPYTLAVGGIVYIGMILDAIKVRLPEEQ